MKLDLPFGGKGIILNPLQCLVEHCSGHGAGVSSITVALHPSHNNHVAVVMKKLRLMVSQFLGLEVATVRLGMAVLVPGVRNRSLHSMTISVVAGEGLQLTGGQWWVWV